MILNTQESIKTHTKLIWDPSGFLSTSPWIKLKQLECKWKLKNGKSQNVIMPLFKWIQCHNTKYKSCYSNTKWSVWRIKEEKKLFIARVIKFPALTVENEKNTIRVGKESGSQWALDFTEMVRLHSLFKKFSIIFVLRASKYFYFWYDDIA